jgi:hypothetical protein
MEDPQSLDLGADVVGVRDLVGLGGAADMTAGELVGD